MAWFLVVSFLLIAWAGGYFCVKSRQVPNDFADLAEIERTLRKLAPKIYWCKYLEPIESYGMKLADQFQGIQQSYRVSQEVLQTKFNPSELTYERYASGIQATTLMLIDNLQKLVPLLETLEQNAQNKKTPPSALSERIEQLFQLNAAGLDKFDQLIVSLSHIQNLEGPDEQTAQYLLNDLNSLIERAKHY